MMDRRLKERLVGATILVAVIVLVVPELLSGPKHPLLPPLAAGLPSTPTRSVSVDLATNRATAEPEPAAALQAAPTDAPSPAPDSSASSSAGAGASGANRATTPAAPSTNAGELAPASPPSVATLRAQSSAQPPLETTASPPKSAAMTPRSAETMPHAVEATPRSAGPAEMSASRHAWAVQLGSFASKENADRLMHRLQASGGSFYVAPGGSGSTLRYRVRMGPLADRGAAERALAKLKAQGHSATIVTPAS